MMGRVIAEQTLTGFLLANDDIQLTINTQDHPFHEEYFAKDTEGRWSKILQGGNCGEQGASLVIHLEPMHASLVPEHVEVNRMSSGEASLEIDFAVDEIRIHESIRLGVDEEFFTFQITVEQPRPVGPQSVVNLFTFFPDGQMSGATDFTWTPALRPELGDVIADHALRSPAIVIHKSMCTAVLIPDVLQLEAERRVKTSADLDLDQQEAPLLSYGLRDWIGREHTFYKHLHTMTLPASQTPFRYGLKLLLSRRLSQDDLLTEVSSFLWRRVGRVSLAAHPPFGREQMEQDCTQAWENATSNLWVDFSDSGNTRGGINTGRLHWSNNTENSGDVWFDCWMQSLHTGFGLYLYGRRHGRQDYMDKALATLHLALAAPQHEGIFPTIAYKEKGSGRIQWMPDSGWAGHPDFFHAMDCSWTGYWMLQFADEVPSIRQAVADFCIPYARFLLANQKDDGLIPSWYDRNLQPLVDLLYDVNAETGTSALFLVAMANATREAKYLQAAQRALEFIERRVIPTGYWFDHETFYACADKEFDFYDHHTNQPPQNTLSMIHTAMAYWELTCTLKHYKHLENGIRVLSRLAMYQQLWSPPYFSIPTFGGFGVQNTDAEWSDARQAYCANLFYNYFSVTGNEEYRQRAVSALRAAFQVAPAENWAHDLHDGPGAEDCFHWGIGSAAAAAAILTHRHGQEALIG